MPYPLHRQSKNVVGVGLGRHSLDKKCRIRRPGSPRMSWVSV